MRVQPAQDRARLDPYSVQRQKRPPRGKARRGGGVAEAGVQPAQGATPEEPFVEVSEQHCRRGLLARQGEQPAYLQAPLVGAKPEVGRDQAQRPGGSLEQREQRAARLAARDAQIDGGGIEHRQARQHRVAVMTVGAQQRRSREGGVAQLQGELLQEVHRVVGPPLQLLQRDGVGVELAQDGERAFGIESAVAADAAMDVVSGDDDRHVAQCARRASQR